MNHRERMRATFKEMVAQVNEQHGGSAVCRIPMGDNPCGAVIVYVEGVTARKVADAAEKVQSDFEKYVNEKPKWWHRFTRRKLLPQPKLEVTNVDRN